MTGMTHDLCHPDTFGKPALSAVEGAQDKVKRRIPLSRGLVNLGTDPSLRAWITDAFVIPTSR
jgi:hypothetical protein